MAERRVIDCKIIRYAVKLELHSCISLVTNDITPKIIQAISNKQHNKARNL